MLDCAWRGDLLMQRGCLSAEELRDAVREGYFDPQRTEGVPMPYEDYFKGWRIAADNFAAYSCFYKLTAKGWWTGVAIGASFEDPRSRGDGTGRHAALKLPCP